MTVHRTVASETVTDSGSELREPVVKDQVPDAPHQDHEKVGGAGPGHTAAADDKKRKGKAVVTAAEERHP
jgi:hypothetical protein